MRIAWCICLGKLFVCIYSAFGIGTGMCCMAADHALMRMMMCDNVVMTCYGVEA